MSNIGRKPIAVGNLKVTVTGNTVRYEGKKDSGDYELPPFIQVTLDDGMLALGCKDCNKDRNRFWGMHRALLANVLHGADVGFSKTVQIEGLGYKAALSGNKITLKLGFSHTVDVDMLKGVELKIDKQGKQLTFSSHDKALVGQMCDKIRSIRPPEPYKGTGVRLADEVIKRKAGKTKAA